MNRRLKGRVKAHWCMLVSFTMAGVLSLLFNCGDSLAKEQIIWKGTSAYGSGLSYYQIAKYFADRVKDMSAGRLIIQVNTGGSIVPVFSEQEAVNTGAVDLACTSSMYIRGKFPASVLIGTSMYAFKQQEFLAWLEYGGGYQLWQEMYDRKGWNVHVLPTYCIYPTESLGWYRKPIQSLADFKGMKFRTVGEWGEVMTKLGASVVTLPSGELYSALERGVLDGVEMSHPSFDKGLGLYEVCKYMVFPGVHQTSGPMETLVKKDKWNALPDDLKSIVEAAAREATLRSMTYTVIQDREAVEFFKEHGVHIMKLNKEVLDRIKVLVDEVLDEHASKDPFYAKILNSQREFHKNWSQYEELQSWK
jgi:TRAP-type mannitol/chloroaromatic compound transport system substrate-binding protein